MLQLNTGSLYGVMRDFYTLTKIRIVIFDADFQELLAYPAEKEDFCAMLRKEPEGETLCRRSDRNGCLQCAMRKELVLYQCHAGLMEAVVPIYDKNGVIAYVMFGQVIAAEHAASTAARIRQAYPAFSETAERIPVKSGAQLRAAGTILQAITSYAMSNRWVAPGKSEFSRQLDRYIEDHLSQRICVEDLCDAFCIGRTRLYELCADYLGCGLAEYVRGQRIHHAQRLLRETTLPVTDIAYAVGFSDYSHFSRIFKQFTGLSARDYRKTDNSP